MTLTWPVFLAVLGGALLHASWNVLVKSSDDKALDTALIHLLGSLVAATPESWSPERAGVALAISSRRSLKVKRSPPTVAT